MPTFETPPQSYIEAEANALIAEERAQLTNRCNWFEKALEERTDELNEKERAVIRLHDENKTLREKLEDMWEWTTNHQVKIRVQEELLQSTKTALRRAEERVEAHEARPAVEDESPVQRQLHQALGQARKQVRELRVALDEKEDEINFLSKELHNATTATLTPTQSLALRNYKRVQLEDAIEEMLPMLAAENEFLKQVITKAWDLGSTVEATYYDYKQLPSQPVPGSSQSSTLTIGYMHDEMSVDFCRNASPELEVYMRQPEMEYSIYNENSRLHYLTRRDSTPTIMTIDTEPEQSYLDEMDVGVDTSSDQEMVNASSDTAITGPLIRLSPPSKAWSAFRESPTLDVDSENEDKEPLSKRQRDRPLGDKTDKGQTTGDECWCSQFSMLDETLVRRMASLKIIDNAVAVIDKASSPPAPALPQTSRSIGVQAEVQVPPDVHAEDKNGPADPVTPLPPGTRSSKSFALFSNGPVYLPHLRIPSWHGWTWRSKLDPPPGQEKKRPTILDLPPYPKVDPPLPDRVSPIREALSTRVDGQPIPRGQPSGANRGIGLNLARALAERNWNVVGTVRPQTKAANDPSVKEIDAVASRVLEVDHTDESTVIKAAQDFGKGPLDMLINLAGIGPEPDNWYEHTAEIIKEKFAVNTVGPFLSKHFYPNLRKASGTIINISPNAGSITMCKGEDMAYRMSKAALNMMTITLAKEFIMNGDNITVVALNPGYVATKLTNYRFKDDVDECIAGIVEVLEGVSMEQTGMFLDWHGEVLPW